MVTLRRLFCLFIITASVLFAQPSVTAVVPAANARTASRTAAVSITFSEAMDAASFVAGSTVRVTGEQCGAYAGSISYDAGTHTATFTPSTEFIAGERVTVLVTTGVKNASAVSLSAPYSWTFSTVAQRTNHLSFSGYAYGTQGLRSIAPADLDGDGDLDLASVSDQSNKASVVLNDGAGTFTAPYNYPVGNMPFCITAADLDGDGDIDLVTANSNAASVSILFNNGDGMFAPQIEVATAGNPRTVTVADFDGDGDADLTVSTISACLSILRNNGNGTFAPHADIALGEISYSVTAGDVDGDGDPDLVATLASGPIAVLLNDGTGIFGTPMTFTAGFDPYCVMLADVDGNGTLDAATANNGNNSVSVLSNDGSGTFSLVRVYPAGQFPRALAAADMDGDGDVDLVAVNIDSHTATILRNDGTGMFTVSTLSSGLAYPSGGVFADLNGDGALDLGFSNAGLSFSTIFQGDSAAPAVTSVLPAPHAVNIVQTDSVCVTLNVPVTGSSVTAPSSVQVTGEFHGRYSGTFSFNEDTTVLTFHPATPFLPGEQITAELSTGIRNELDQPMSAGYRWTFRVRSAAADTLVPFTTITGFNYPDAVLAADLDGDGDEDIVVTRQSLPGLCILKNNGTGGFADRTDLLTGYACGSGIVAADLDGDGDLDLAVSNTASLLFLWNAGDGTFPVVTSDPTYSASRSIAAADVDGDGDVDLVTSGDYANTIFLYRNNGDRTFTTSSIASISVFEGNVILTDVDGDGDADLVFVGTNSNTVKVWKNDGTGVFYGVVSYATQLAPYRVVAADLNGDGWVDLVAGNAASASVSVLLNNGDGTFAAQIPYPTGANPFIPTVCDLDGDGDIDIITTNNSSNTLSVLKNNGDGSFTDPFTYPTGASPRSVVAADIDGDGDLDLMNVNGSGHSLFIMTNSTVAALPVELASFTAESSVHGVQLRWNTATEVNNRGFEVERIVKGKSQKEKGKNEQWETIGFVEGHGTTNAPQSYAFTDASAAGTVRYRLKQVDRDGKFSYSSDVEATVAAPMVFALAQNYPNPFNPSTTIRFTLEKSGPVSLKVYDIVGREVATLVNDVLPAGEYHERMFDASRLSSGIYIARLTSGGKSSMMKMMLLR